MGCTASCTPRIMIGLEAACRLHPWQQSLICKRASVLAVPNKVISKTASLKETYTYTDIQIVLVPLNRVSYNTLVNRN